MCVLVDGTERLKKNVSIGCLIYTHKYDNCLSTRGQKHLAKTASNDPAYTGKGRKVTSAGWQVTLCDPIWYVISRSGEVSSPTA